jgi:hypothetical protein
MPLKKIVGYCGIVCSDCPVFIVTQKNDNAGRKRVAEMLTEQYKEESKPEDINCDGCISDSQRIYEWCNLCEIRKCAREKSVENCTHCSEYQCEKLLRYLSKSSKDKEIWGKIKREFVKEQC